MHHEHALKTAEASKNAFGPVDFAGTWKNQMGSTMDLTVNGSDLTGEYISKTSAEPGGGEVRGPIKGFVKGDLISLLVLWPSGSMTAWVGQYVDEDGSGTIRTLWHLVTEIPDEHEDDLLWQSIFAGADEFVRS